MKNSEKVVVVTRLAPSIADELDRIISASPIKMNRTKMLERLVCLYVADNKIIDEVEPETEVASTPEPIQPAVEPVTMTAEVEEEDVDDIEDDFDDAGEDEDEYDEYVDDVDEEYTDGIEDEEELSF